MLSRRSLLAGLIASFAAPAIVQASNLMQIAGTRLPLSAFAPGFLRIVGPGIILDADLTDELSAVSLFGEEPTDVLSICAKLAVHASDSDQALGMSRPWSFEASPAVLTAMEVQAIQDRNLLYVEKTYEPLIRSFRGIPIVEAAEHRELPLMPLDMVKRILEPRAVGFFTTIAAESGGALVMGRTRI
jgi:hypothetical protein